MVYCDLQRRYDNHFPRRTVAGGAIVTGRDPAALIIDYFEDLGIPLLDASYNDHTGIYTVLADIYHLAAIHQHMTVQSASSTDSKAIWFFELDYKRGN